MYFFLKEFNIFLFEIKYILFIMLININNLMLSIFKYN